MLGAARGFRSNAGVRVWLGSGDGIPTADRSRRRKLLARWSARARVLFSFFYGFCGAVACSLDASIDAASFQSSDRALWSVEHRVSIVVGHLVVDLNLGWLVDVYGLKFVPWSMGFSFGLAVHIESVLTIQHYLLVGAESFAWE